MQVKKENPSKKKMHTHTKSEQDTAGTWNKIQIYFVFHENKKKEEEREQTVRNIWRKDNSGKGN